VLFRSHPLLPGGLQREAGAPDKAEEPAGTRDDHQGSQHANQAQEAEGDDEGQQLHPQSLLASDVDPTETSFSPLPGSIVPVAKRISNDLFVQSAKEKVPGSQALWGAGLGRLFGGMRVVPVLMG
jgi:hypothetical protein